MSDAGEQRQFPRVLGPFDGYLLGLVDLPIQLYNVSLGGCFVNAFQHAPAPGKRLALRIEVSERCSIEVQAEVRFAMADFGYGLRFVDLSDETRAQLHDALVTLESRRAW